MNDSCKPWYLSKGLLGPAASMILVLLRSSGYVEVDEDQVSRILYAMAELGGLMIGMVGRALATKRIVFTPAGSACQVSGATAQPNHDTSQAVVADR
jgi:hypothetical protein